jgi:multicomponent Na+:H+ antiporter subunit E
MRPAAHGWRSARWWPLALLRLLLAALLWWILAEGAADAWYVGIPAVLLATAASLRWSGTAGYRVRLAAVPPLLIYFLRGSLLAGIDVARRALAPAVRLNPGLVQIPTSLPAGAPRWLLTTTLSLMPGSLTVAVSGDGVLLHSLDRGRDLTPQVRAVEHLVAALFGVRSDDRRDSGAPGDGA